MSLKLILDCCINPICLRLWLLYDYITLFNKGGKILPELEVGDKVRIQNQTTVRKMRWDKTGVITGTVRDRQ